MSSKMPAKTLKALQGSIQKWEKIVEGAGRDEGPRNCPLCKLFHANGCDGCPVATRTNKPYCISSPYEAWDNYSFDVGEATDATSRKFARAELKFLKSLLPK